MDILKTIKQALYKIRRTPKRKPLQMVEKKIIKTAKPKKEKKAVYDVYGYPTGNQPHNEVLDVQRYLPIYTKGAKSKSFFCAGYYIVKFNGAWTKAFCPKLITLQRYSFCGPYHTKEQMQEQLRNVNGE